MPDISLFKPPKELKILRITIPNSRIIAIGDVHGCIEELKELIDKLSLKFDATRDDSTIVFLGDLVDRGPDSEGVVQYIKNLSLYYKVYLIASNHDEKVLRYHHHQLKAKEDPKYKVPMRCPGSYNELSESSLEYLAQAQHVVYMSNEGFTGSNPEPYPICFVHAGIGPGVFNQPPNAFVRNRYFTKNVKDHKLTPVKSIEIDGNWYIPEGSNPWHYFWDGRWTIVYGHSVNYAPLIINNTINIDGGCCFGGYLRAWVKEENKQFFVDVKAKQVYSG